MEQGIWGEKCIGLLASFHNMVLQVTSQGIRGQMRSYIGSYNMKIMIMLPTKRPNSGLV